MMQPPRQDVQRLRQLAATIEAEIVPRLLVAHRGAAPPPALPSPADVAELVTLVLGSGGDTAPAIAFVRGLQARGCRTESLLLDLLAPAARALGELWGSDESDFAQVTVALGHLQEILRETCPPAPRSAPGRRDGRAVLAPAPGEQHTLGVSLVAEFLQRAGWEVAGGPWLGTAELLDVVRTRWCDVAGLSLSCDRQLDDVAESVAAIRRASRNRGIAVLVGGPVFRDNPALVARVGADATADARDVAATAAALRAARQPPEPPLPG
jgi:methanogenic corrinoid protein MtbC1